MKGWWKDDAIKALESCGFHARTGLRVLEQKSLITMHFNLLGMHDHIVEMGKNIVRRGHPNEPHNHSRLWKIDEIEEILVNDLGPKATKCILFHTLNFNPHIFIKGLRKMKELRFLSVGGYCCSDLEFSMAGLDFPNALRYLDWTGYPFSSLPTTFQANNLVALKMYDSRIVQLWEGGESKVLNKLRFLDLRYSMLTTFDLGLTPNLETLDLHSCKDLLELHMTAGCLKLTSVNLTGSRLRALDLGLAPNLEELLLYDSNDLEKLHLPGRCLNLRELILTDSKLKTLDIGLTPNLEKIILLRSSCLEELHMANKCQKLTQLKISHSKLRALDLGMTPNLKKLYLQKSSCLEKLHMANECQKLTKLKISHSKLRALDLGMTPNLKKLYLQKSSCLEKLHMANECQKLTKLEISHSKLRALNLGMTPNLKKLYLEECRKLVELHTPIACLRKLVRVYLSGCLCSISFLFYINEYYSFSDDELLEDSSCSDDESLEVGPLTELHLSVETLERCPLHPDNNLPKFRFDCKYYHEDRPSLTRNLEMLFSLGMCTCTDIETFSQIISDSGRLRELELKGSFLEAIKDLDRLECLEKLNLSSTKINHLPRSICTLKHLKSLKLIDCLLLERLPEDLARLECLEKLTLSSTTIKHLPDSICLLKRLQSLKLIFCWLLEKLPEGLGELESLRKLTLSSAKIKHLPDSICMLKCLTFLKLDHCLLLEKLPKELGRLEHLRKLHVRGTNISYLPQSILLLKGLYISGSRGLLESYGLLELYGYV